MIESSSTAIESVSDDLPTLPLWTFVLGVLALLTLGLTSVPAVICGHRAIAETKRSNDQSLARSVAIVGLVIGYVGVGLMVTWIMVTVRLFISH